MSNLEAISSTDLSTINGGQQNAPQRPTPAQDAARIVGTGVDIARGQESVRGTVDRTMSGWQKGTSLPASNGFERFVNGVGGAAIEAFKLGW